MRRLKYEAAVSMKYRKPCDWATKMFSVFQHLQCLIGPSGFGSRYLVSNVLGTIMIAYVLEDGKMRLGCSLPIITRVEVRYICENIFKYKTFVHLSFLSNCHLYHYTSVCIFGYWLSGFGGLRCKSEVMKWMK